MTRPYNLEDPTIVRPVMQSNMKFGVLSVKTAAAYTVDVASPPIIMIDPTGGAHDVLLPPEAEGLVYWIFNLHATNDLTLKNDANAALDGAEIVNAKEAVMAVCDATTWRAFKMTLATS